MKLLVIFVCVALFVFVKGESEVEVEEMEHVEEETERGCVGKWGKCNDNADCCKDVMQVLPCWLVQARMRMQE
uniref:U43-Deinotoxin-Dsu1al_1 n=1 Tax=Deinopis subrufa TaxID=1905329 RepID=A0A4Q8KCE3_DEISU